ncbi:MAG TPA: PEP-CTERM sorting domain-containing protein [Verrucomicrobiae bacterium]|nr:PEP-CTERM sorting domain-containing protein [Verrucomicrobiae bacterium]
MTTRNLTLTAVITLLLVTRGYAPNVVDIGNGTQLLNGTYLNAGKIANNLVFTSITVQAVTNINIVDNIDLADASNGGTPHFNLALVTPALNLTNNILFGAGDLILNAQTVNLNGTVMATNGTLLSAPQISGSATQVNVLSDAASLQQAIDLASPTSPVAVQVSPGQYPGDLTIGNKQVTLQMQLAGYTVGMNGYVQVDANDALVSGATLQLQLLGGFIPTNGAQFVILDNSGSQAIGGTFAAASEGSTNDFGSGVLFAITYAGNGPSGGGNDILLTVVPEPTTWVLLALGCGCLLAGRGARFGSVERIRLGCKQTARRRS